MKKRSDYYKTMGLGYMSGVEFPNSSLINLNKSVRPVKDDILYSLEYISPEYCKSVLRAAEIELCYIKKTIKVVKTELNRRYGRKCMSTVKGISKEKYKEFTGRNPELEIINIPKYDIDVYKDVISKFPEIEIANEAYDAEGTKIYGYVTIMFKEKYDSDILQRFWELHKKVKIQEIMKN